MLQQLYVIIERNETGAYGPLYESLLMDPATQLMVQSIKQKELDGMMLTEELRKTGFPQFNSAAFIEKSKAYLDGFVKWILAETMTKVCGECQVCAAQHIFESAYEFVKSDQICGAPAGGTEQCQGRLMLMSEDVEHTAA